MRYSYPGDITREQFSEIEPLLLKARKRTAPRRVDLYEVFCAVLYVLKTACQWRALPHDFPKWNVDGGYTGEKFSDKIKSTIGATVEVAKRSELHQFAVISQRWVVERSFAWLEKCRRLWKNCERKIHMSLQMVVLAFLTLLLKRL
jgi:transposase